MAALRGYGIVVSANSGTASARTLRRLGTSALDLLGTHRHPRVTIGPDGFETVHRPHAPKVLFGLVGSEFVAGAASPAALRAFAAAPAAAAPEAQGAAAFRIALPELLQLTLPADHAEARSAAVELTR